MSDIPISAGNSLALCIEFDRAFHPRDGRRCLTPALFWRQI